MDQQPGSDPDLVLLERWRAQDRQAGEQLFSRHFDGIFRFFEHKVGAEADELSQRTFLACLEARDQFQARSTFRTFLFAIARHVLFAHLRNMARAAQMDFSLTSLADISPSAGSRLDRQRAGARLRELLQQLPLEQQLLLELHYWHDLDAQALAEVFSVPQGTVRVRLSRARGLLREKIEQVDRLDDIGTDRLSLALSQPDSEPTSADS